MLKFFEYPLDPFAEEHHVLVTKLDADECKVRLLDRLLPSSYGPDAPLPSDRQFAILGSVDTEGFLLRKEIAYRNTFQTEATGNFISTRDGTRIIVRLGASRKAKAFAMAAMGFSLVLSTILVLRWLHEPASPWADFSLPLAVFFPIFIYAYLVANRWLARQEGELLLRVVRRELETAEV